MLSGTLALVLEPSRPFSFLFLNIKMISNPVCIMYYYHHHALIITLHPSLFSIPPCRSSKLHPVSAQSWYKLTLVYPYVEVHRRKLLISPSLLFQQCTACLYSCCFVGSGFLDLFLYSSHQAFSLGILLAFMWCIHTVVLIQL